MTTSQSRRAILLVEDDVNDVFLFERALKKAQVPNPLVIAQDGQEAIEVLSGTSSVAGAGGCTDPALIILDLNLPRGTGLEVLAWIRGTPRFSGVPVLAFTSSSDDRDVTEAYKLGVSSYLVKPGDPADLLDLVSAIKVYWLESNRGPGDGPR